MLSPGRVSPSGSSPLRASSAFGPPGRPSELAFDVDRLMEDMRQEVMSLMMDGMQRTASYCASLCAERVVAARREMTQQWSQERRELERCFGSQSTEPLGGSPGQDAWKLDFRDNLEAGPRFDASPDGPGSRSLRGADPPSPAAQSPWGPLVRSPRPTSMPSSPGLLARPVDHRPPVGPPDMGLRDSWGAASDPCLAVVASPRPGSGCVPFPSPSSSLREFPTSRGDGLLSDQYARAAGAVTALEERTLQASRAVELIEEAIQDFNGTGDGVLRGGGNHEPLASSPAAGPHGETPSQSTEAPGAELGGACSGLSVGSQSPPTADVNDGMASRLPAGAYSPSAEVAAGPWPVTLAGDEGFGRVAAQVHNASDLECDTGLGPNFADIYGT